MRSLFSTSLIAITLILSSWAHCVSAQAPDTPASMDDAFAAIVIGDFKGLVDGVSGIVNQVMPGMGAMIPAQVGGFFGDPQLSGFEEGDGVVGIIFPGDLTVAFAEVNEDQHEAYIQKSPLFELEKVKTPTIIFHGSEDRAVPRDQGHEYYRAMQQSAQAPVRFLWFPGQPHELGKITHQLRKMKEELAWIDRYLFGKESQENAAFKADSPLALLLKKDSLSAQQGLYGLQHNGKLIPEAAVVAKDSISVGRFEVTNAQFAAFDPGFSFPAGQGNYPAQVSLDQAKRYVLWLSAHTGQPYRLPNTREARAFHHEAHQAGPMENTLNYWAGHTLTVDEVPLLRQKMEGRNLSLVKEAGQFAPIKLGAAEIFDLGGNLAEYCEDGNTYGYSAYDYVDPNSEQPPRSENTAGFRVILEAGAITDGQKN